MSIRFLVHKFGADATKDMCNMMEDLNLLMCNVNKTKFVPKKGDLIVNWGVLKYPGSWNNDGVPFNVLNQPHLVCQSGNRLKSLPIMAKAGVNVPEFTTQYDVAREWLNKGSSVIRREHVRSRSGHGLTFVEPVQNLQTGGAIYSRYQPKRHEYRVHVFRGAAIDVQQKRKRKNFTGTVDFQIRSYDNGWVFCRQGIVVPDEVVAQSIRAVAALGLDFGATDVGWTEKDQKAVVYEVNTAPGLKGTTTKKYAEAIRDYYKKVSGGL